MFESKRGFSRAPVAVCAAFAATDASAQDAEAAFTVVPPDQRLTLGRIFADAAPLVQVLMAGLAIAAVVAVAVWVVNLMSLSRRQPGRGLLGGVAFLSALGAAGPLVGCFGAAYILMHGAMGAANVRPAPDLTIMAPGFAEAFAVVSLGLLAAAIGVIGHRHLQAKIKGLELHAEEPASQSALTLSQTARMIG